MANLLTDETVRTFKSSTLMKILGCDLGTAKKLKAGEITLNSVKPVSPKKTKVIKEEK